MEIAHMFRRRGMTKALAATMAVFAAAALAVFAGASGVPVTGTAIAAQQVAGWAVTASVVVVGLLGYVLVRKTFF